MSTDLTRRRILFGGATIAGAGLLAACTSNEPEKPANTGPTAAAATGGNAAPGTTVTIGFSAPAADHGWIRAISDNAKAQAGKYTDVKLVQVDAGKDAPAQIAALEALIAQKPNVIVLLPQDGAQLTATGKKAMDAGIPVVNLDREFSDAAASFTLIKGDNYGMGVSAGHYIGKKLKGKADAVIAEIAGIDTLQLTQDRSKGFADTLATYGLKVTNRVAAQFTVQSGQDVTANLLQAAPKIDAIWNHDDDQGVGVLAAIENAGRDEFIMVGGAGSKNAMQAIQSGDSVLKATVIYPSTQAADGVKLARLLVQGKSMSDLVEVEVPRTVQLYAPVVTADNVDQFIGTAFAS